MNKGILLCAILVLFTGVVNARPLSAKQLQKVENYETLRDQMDAMVLSIADLDILINRDKVLDYDIFKEDAERILNSIDKIRGLDPEGIFEPYIKQLEKHAQKLLYYAIKKDEKALKYPQKIFDTCFQCHQKHRN